MSRQLSEILGRKTALQVSVDTTFSEHKETNSQSEIPDEVYEPHHEIAAKKLPETHTYTAEDLDSHFSTQAFAQPNQTSEDIHPGFDSLPAPSAYFNAQQQQHFDENLPPSTFNHFEHKTDFDKANDSYENHESRTAEKYENYDRQTQTQTHSPGLTLPQIPSINNLQQQARLNPRYTFDTFVIGESNRFAHATALAVSEAPGSTYNPLFLYSDSGMGKTHLLHAIGNYTVSLYPNKKVLYISSEEFTNAFINALRDNKIYSFKDQFRNIDVLLIDDIQFISNRDSTIEEFFHTFNALSNANKQIVITSDVAPKLLQGFEERMISRFASGITASIDLPNLETRIAILEKKSAAESIQVPRPVLEFIASKMTTNVREMEGALRRIAALRIFHGSQFPLKWRILC
ncbi:chromosomal replication initiator protein DnaA [Arcanobacterium hippocoleae]